jgi:hypothetical protein
MLVCLSLGFVFNTFLNTSDKRLQDVKEENTYLKSQLARKDSLLQDLQTQLIITTGILRQVPPVIDSIAKEKTQKQVNNLIRKKND